MQPTGRRTIYTVFPLLLTLFLADRADARKPDPEKTIPVEEMTLHVVPQSHIDLAWWWRYDPHTTQVIVRRTLEMAFANLEAFPEYTFTFLQVPAIRATETLYPDLFYRIHYYLFHSAPLGSGLPNPHGTDPEKGRFKIASGLFLELDAAVPSGESLVRQCLYGKRYFKHQFGLDVKSAWFQDAWTHPWTYPQILKKSGIESYMFNRGQAGSGDERMFWWEAPDGSRVFAYKPANPGGQLSRDGARSEMSEAARRYGVRDHIALVGVGNHGGGANSKDIADWRKTMAEISPGTRFSTHTKFLSAVLAHPDPFPVLRGEIEPTLRGVYTTVAEIKKKHRESEDFLLTLEKFSSIAAQMGQARYPHGDLNASWEKLMLNQFHDTISGTDIPPANDDALRLFEEILDTGRKNLARTFGAISAKIDTSGQGVPVVLFNPLSWSRTGVAEVALESGAPIGATAVSSPGEKGIPAQVVGRHERDGKHFATLLFVAGGVPSMGYKTYRLGAAPPSSAPAGSLRASESELENEFLRVTLDAATGCVGGIYDKRNQREALDKSRQGNLIQVIEDFGDSEGFLRSAAGEIETRHRWTGRTWNLAANPQVRVLEAGPVRAVVEVKKKWELARFTQRIILYAGSPQVDFELDIDWKGKNKMVKVAFPLSVTSPEATCEIPYGAIRRPSLGEEQAAQKWVDISDANYGVSLLNAGRNGYDVRGNIVRLSVLRSPDRPAFNTDEAGMHSLRYAIYPHRGGWQGAGTVQRGYELNNPLLPYLTTAHPGDLPPASSFLTIEPENLIVEALKRAEDSDQQYVLRLYDSEGKKSTAKITWTGRMDAVHHVDLLENSTADLPTNGLGIQVPVGAYSIESFKLIRDLVWPVE